MFGSPILDVAIGMAFLYLLLSLIASAVQEIIASIIQSRSANLQRGLRSLFSGDRFNSAKPLVELLYEHGLIRGLYQDPSRDYGPGNEEPARFQKVRRAFGKLRLFLRWLFRMQPPGIPFDVDDLLLPAYIPARTFAMAMRDILNNPKPFGWDSLRNIEENLSTLRQKYKDNKAVEALLVLVVDAAGDPERLQTNLENWYSDAMDRISGWYKRYVQNALVLIGLILAIGFNVDSVQVARTLWMDKDARAGLATAAGEYLSHHPDPQKSSASSTSAPAATGAAEAPVGASGTEAQPAAPSTAAASGVPQSTPSSGQGLIDTDLRDKLNSTVGAFNDVAEKTLLPVGWKYTRAQYRDYLRRERVHALPHMLRILIGWIITAAALSFGAPFWFDTLNKFMVVRSTVKPQEKSQVEPSKDS